MAKVCIDPGHGGHDPGAVGTGGLQEKAVALNVALTLGKKLQTAGLEVVYTRRTDDFVRLSGRAAIANRHAADLLVSIHCNAFERVEAKGYEVWTTPGRTEADRLATALFESFQEEFPGRKGRVDTLDGDPDKEANFAVLRLTRCPAALFELGFISNPDGERWLADEMAQHGMAEALRNGVLRYLGIDRRDLPMAPKKPVRGERDLERTLREIGEVLKRNGFGS